MTRKIDWDKKRETDREQTPNLWTCGYIIIYYIVCAIIHISSFDFRPNRRYWICGYVFGACSQFSWYRFDVKRNVSLFRLLWALLQCVWINCLSKSVCIHVRDQANSRLKGYTFSVVAVVVRIWCVIVSDCFCFAQFLLTKAKNSN